jgi:hypothetical protein
LSDAFGYSDDERPHATGEDRFVPVWQQFQTDLESVLKAEHTGLLVIDLSGLDQIAGQRIGSTPMDSVFTSAMKSVQNLGGAFAL